MGIKHPIPGESLDDRLGFIGTSGSGKSYNAGTAVELLLDEKARVVIIDPTGVWWGLRLLADGKTQSKFDVVIFGGDHADLPLNEQAGALIGETAATMAESCIIDLSKLPSRSAEQRFMVAFLETIYRKAGGEPFHLVVDEADLFAPQKPQAGDELLLGHMENIVRRGRVRGFIPWLISQRPAVLNKNVLSQVDGLLAFKLTASQDRDALDAWIEGQADKAQGKAIKDALPTFQVGEGVVWLPGQGILERRPFPEKVTFDSSRKPKRGEKAKSRQLKPVNVDRLKAQLAEFVEQQKANDVPTLKKRIAELEAAAKKAAAAPAPAIDNGAIAAAEQVAYEQGYAAATEVAWKAFNGFKALVVRIGEQMHGAVNASRLEFPADRRFRPSRKSGSQQSPLKAAPTPKPVPAAALPARQPSPAAGGDGTISATMRETLGALAWWAALGHEHPSKKQLAGMLRIVPDGSTMRSRLAALSVPGLIEYPEPGRVMLTEAGRAAAPAPDTSATLVETIRASLTPIELATFDAIPADPATSISREDLARLLGGDKPIEPNGSTMRSRLANLSVREIIRYPGNGYVARQDWVTG